MPFEVYSVAPMHLGATVYPEVSQIPPRTPEDVAEEIRQHYEAVALRGGSIIASHSVSYAHEGLRKLGNYTFLVAEIPEAQ